ncbi:hypothetical protein Btru_005449 [Bulinus truncatus]|nr:hypothetical protein Btru_005449 [Bulinus truncatus]
MKYVYLVTSAGYYLLCLIILGYSYLRSYRIYYIEAGGPTTNCYFNLFVSGWDYGITSEETSELKHQSLYNEIKEYLSGQQKHETGMDRDQFIRIWLIRLMTWSLVLGILTLSGYMTLAVSTKLSISIDPQETLASESVMESLTTPIILSSIQPIVPMSFSFLESYEGYRYPKMNFMCTCFVLGDIYWRGNLPIGYSGSDLCTWLFIFHGIYQKNYLKDGNRSNERNSPIGKHTLDLIYSQSLCWLGLFYAPLMPLVVIVKFIIIFYVKRHDFILHKDLSLSHKAMVEQLKLQLITKEKIRCF